MGITKYFKDCYGCTASISIDCRTDNSTLYVRDGHGNLFHKKTYFSYRSAKIALGKLSGGMMHEVPVSVATRT